MPIMPITPITTEGRFSTGHGDRRALLVGHRLSLFVSYPLDRDTVHPKPQWTSSDTAIARIELDAETYPNSVGYFYEIVGVSPGSITIEGTAGPTQTFRETIHVVDPNVVERITVELHNANRASALPPSQFNFVATAIHPHGCTTNVSHDAVWSTSNDTIARSLGDDGGTFKALHDGDVTVTARFQNHEASCSGIVEDGVFALLHSISLYDSTLFVGFITPVSLFTFASAQNWSPKRPDAVTITTKHPDVIEITRDEDSQKWLIQGLRAGKATIGCQLGTNIKTYVEREIEAHDTGALRLTPLKLNDDQFLTNSMFIDETKRWIATHFETTSPGIDPHRRESLTLNRNVIVTSSAPDVIAIDPLPEYCQGSFCCRPRGLGKATIRAECKALNIVHELVLDVYEREMMNW